MTVKVSPKYQVVIPADVRKNANIRPGMEVRVLSKGNIIYITPVQTLEEVSQQYCDQLKKVSMRRYREKKDKSR